MHRSFTPKRFTMLWMRNGGFDPQMAMGDPTRCNASAVRDACGMNVSKI